MIDKLFTKTFKNDTYEILFNNRVGLEITRGINGNPDPFSLELPSLLDIGIMGTCQHKCDWCYQGHENKPNMKLENFKSIIDQVSHHVNQVALGGRGDPNKHENFREIIEYCVEKNVVPNYTTSGINLTDEEIEISQMCGAVAVSEYGKYFTYEALNKFIDAGITTNIHFMFSSASYKKAINILKGINIWETTKRLPRYPDNTFFNVEKLNAVVFLLFKPQGAGSTKKYLIPSKDQIKEFAELVFSPKSKFKVGMDSCLINHVLKYGTPNAIQRMSIDTCEAGRMSAYITPDMKMKACSFAHPRQGADLNTCDIKSVWDEDQFFNTFRSYLKAESNCCPLGL